MRLFIAINFPNSVKKAIVCTQDRLKSCIRSGNFTRYENLHLTLAFLGETDESRIDALRTILDALPCTPFTLTFNRLGSFQGGLWWIGAEDTPPLTAMQNALTDALQREGFAYDKKPFVPHLTLVRQAVMKSEPRFPFLPFSAEIHSVSLMSSSRENGKLIYREIHRKDF